MRDIGEVDDIEFNCINMWFRMFGRVSKRVSPNGWQTRLPEWRINR